MKMIRVFDHDMQTECKKSSTAIRRFIKKYPEMEEWRSDLEWMFEAGETHLCDDTMSNGKRNNDWSFSVWAEVLDDGLFYISVTLREPEQQQDEQQQDEQQQDEQQQDEQQQDEQPRDIDKLLLLIDRLKPMYDGSFRAYINSGDDEQEEQEFYLVYNAYAFLMDKLTALYSAYTLLTFRGLECRLDSDIVRIIIEVYEHRDKVLYRWHDLHYSATKEAYDQCLKILKDFKSEFFGCTS